MNASAKLDLNMTYSEASNFGSLITLCSIYFRISLGRGDCLLRPPLILSCYGIIIYFLCCIIMPDGWLQLCQGLALLFSLRQPVLSRTRTVTYQQRGARITSE